MKLKPVAHEAWQTLKLGMLDNQPACTGDERYLVDELSNATRQELKQICNSCPLLVECYQFASVENPLGGWWPHKIGDLSK